MACKLFHDGVHIIKEGEKNAKYVQDRIPENCHKCFKKKQWRKQFFEAMRRVCCRLALGKGFRPNCVAEDVFIHAILGMSFELGWRRIAVFIENLPESDADKDFTRVTRLGANDEVGSMLKAAAANASGTDAAAPVKEKKATKGPVNAAVANAKLDVKSWFQCYELTEDHLFDHIVTINEDETDAWSINTGSTMGSEQRERCESNLSITSEGLPLGMGSPPSSPIRTTKARSNSSASSYSVERLYPGIGVPRQAGKARSNSAISSLSTDEYHDVSFSFVSTSVGNNELIYLLLYRVSTLLPAPTR